MKMQTLNGLRGLAALTVMIAHLPQITNTILGYQLKFMLDASRSAYIAVDIFFILSGFLITKNLLEDKKLERFSFKNFYVKRFLRLYPIYYLAILFVGILISWERLGNVATFTSNYYFSFDLSSNPMRHTWSLAVENHFYLIWPLIVYFTSHNVFVERCKYFVIFILLLSFLLYYYFLPTNISNSLLEKGTNTRCISLVLGAFIAYKETYFKDKDKTYKYLLFAIICYVFVFIITLNSGIINEYMPFLIFSLILSALGSTLLFIYILNLENKSNLANTFFTNKILVYVGSISYGLYLYHYPIYYVSNFFGTERYKVIGALQALIPFCLAVVISVISYQFLEKPLAKFRPK